MEGSTSKVYVLTDTQNRILRCEGGYSIGNIQDFTSWTLIDEGHGDAYNLCQNNYFPDGLYTEHGIPRYKLLDGQAVRREEEEIAADIAALPAPATTPFERLQAENNLLKAQVAAAGDRQDFLEDCIAEMAAQVYGA